MELWGSLGLVLQSTDATGLVVPPPIYGHTGLHRRKKYNWQCQSNDGAGFCHCMTMTGSAHTSVLLLCI